MPPNKVTLVEGRLRRRVRALGMPSLARYCRHLFDEDGMQAEAVHLIDAVTTNKTDFFREPEHRYIRFHFAKKDETLHRAGEKLAAKLAQTLG